MDAPTYERMAAILGNPLTRLALLALCVLSLFHWAHRFRHTLYDGLQIKHLNEVIALISVRAGHSRLGGRGVSAVADSAPDLMTAAL